MSEPMQRRKHLLLAQMMLERAELAAEFDHLRHASSPPQLARGLWSTVLGQAAGSGLVASLIGSVLRRRGRSRKEASAAAAGAAPLGGVISLLATLLRPYPMLSTALSTLAPLLGSRRALKGLAIGAGVGVLVWQIRRMRR